MIYYEQSNDETSADRTAACICRADGARGRVRCTGYFADEVFSDIWHHTELTRAGEWHEVRNDNFFMQDFAECNSGLPTGWANGQITWRIPTAWGYVEEGENVYTSAEFGSPYFQIFTLDANGNFRVSKLGYWTERSPDGTRHRSGNMEVQP